MALFKRKDSPFWWMKLAARGARPIRRSTQIPFDAPSSGQRSELRRSAQMLCAYEQAKLVLNVRGVTPPAPAPTRTVAQHLAWYEKHITAHKRGKVRERSMLKRLRTELGAVALKDLTRDRILEWRTARAKVVAPASVNRELDVLSDALTKAVPTYLDASPMLRLKRLHRPATEAIILSREDEPKLLAALAPKDQALVVAALDTLMRAGDLLRLQWAQDHGRFLTVLDPKTARPYRVPVSTRLRTALDALERNGEYVFWHRRRAWQKSASTPLWYMLRSACQKAGIATGRGVGLTFHGLRHTGASRMIEAGIDIRTVQLIGGWASLRHLTRYLHPTDAHLAAAVEAIGGQGPDI